MEFLMAMRHLHLDSVLTGDKEEVLTRQISHHGNSKVAKHFTVRSLISSSLKSNADKRVFFSTKSPVVV